MAAVDVDVVESALRDVNLSSGRETVLKPEQESAVRALLADRDVLAVLRTGYGKSLIYQMFVRAKNYELNGNAAILVISPLKSIIEELSVYYRPVAGYGIVGLLSERFSQFIER